MKTRTSTRTAGSAMILALVTFVILGGVGAALFSLTMASHRTTMNASNADSAYHVAEAGLDDAMNKLVAYAAAPNVDADYAVIGQKTKVGNGEGNVVTGGVNRGTFNVTIEPAYVGLGTYKITSVGTYSGEQRGIITYVQAEEEPSGFKAGLFGDVQIDTGGNLITDGYESSKGYKADQTVVVDGKTYKIDNATGHIGSNGGVSVSGSALVFGNATPGPSQTVTGSGYVHGSKTPAKNAEPIPAIDYNPTTALKTAFPTVTTTTTEGKKKVTTTTYILDGSVYPEYRIDEIKFSSGEQLDVKGHVTLYVEGDVTVTAKGKIIIHDDSSLTLIQKSGSFDVHGGGKLGVDGGAATAGGLPASFTVKTNATSVKINGHSGFYGALIAPKADLTLNGTADYYGGIIAKTIKAVGTASFHYDEDLKSAGVPKIVFAVKSTHQFVPK